jgi:hypothetical protein
MSLSLATAVYASASFAVMSGASLYAHDMKSTGRTPCLRATSAFFFACSRKISFSCGWIGHWLQSMMTAVSNWRPGLLKTISLSPTNE